MYYYTGCLYSFLTVVKNSLITFTYSGRGHDGTPGPPGPPGPPGSISVNDVINLLQRKSHLKVVKISLLFTKDYLPKCVHYLCPGEDVRRYVGGTPGPPGPPGAPGLGSNRFNTQEVADRVLTLMNGECYRWTHRVPIQKVFCRDNMTD